MGSPFSEEDNTHHTCGPKLKEKFPVLQDPLEGKLAEIKQGQPMDNE